MDIDISDGAARFLCGQVAMSGPGALERAREILADVAPLIVAAELRRWEQYKVGSPLEVLKRAMLDRIKELEASDG